MFSGYYSILRMSFNVLCTDFDQVQKVTFGTGFVLDLHLILIPDLQSKLFIDFLSNL